MATPFKIVISATDKASAVVRGIKAEFAGFSAPVRDLSRSLRNLGRETGINHVVKGLQRGVTMAARFGRSIAYLSAPIAALAGAGIVAGIAAIGTSWGRAAQSLSNTSAVIGIGTTDLQRYRGAAQLAGLSAGEMDGSLQALGDTMQGALYGRNQQALALMNAYGISIKRTKDGAVDSTVALLDLSKAIQTNMRSGGNVQSARLIAGAFGAESLLPLLMKGPDAIRSYVAEMDRLNAVMGPQSVEQGVQYNKNLVGMGLAVDSLKYSIGNALIPVFGPLLSSMAEWISKNKDVIASNVGETVQELGNWLKNIDWDAAKKDASEFFKVIENAYNLLKKANHTVGSVRGGFETAGNWLHGRGAKTNEELAQSGASISPGDWYNGDGWGSGDSHATTKTKALFESLEQRENLPPGTLDSIWAQESGRGLRLRSPKGALGQFQFMPATAKQYGLKNPDDLGESADAASRLVHDLLKQNDGNLPRALAAYNWGQGNLNKYGMANAPAETKNYVSEVGERIAIAQANGAGANADGNLPDIYRSKSQAPDDSERSDRLAALKNDANTMQVHIEMGNAPPGTRVNTQSSSNVRTTTRIGYAMDGTNG